MKQLWIALVACHLILIAPVVAEASDEADARATVEAVYVVFAQGIMDSFAALMSPGIVWNEAEGNPYADLNNPLSVILMSALDRNMPPMEVNDLTWW